MYVPLSPAFLTIPLAHRGYHNRAMGVPENSVAAVRAAIAMGYGIEIDVQLSRDGVAMVFHDEAMERLTEAKGLIRDHTAKQLSGIKLRDSDETIPTLGEVLLLVAGRVPLLIEIKDQTATMSASDGRLEVATAQALAGYIGPVAVMSFNPHSIDAMRRLAPEIPRGLTTSAYDIADWAPLAPDRCDQLRDVPDYVRTQSSFISHEAADLDRPRVGALKSQGAGVLCWTIKSAEAERIARQIAQNITFEGYAARLPA